ncbi:MAG: neutral/alkaline non-lysosomal ceramidase N-terminal domain-containing protein [Planctomycetota bacterium]
MNLKVGFGKANITPPLGTLCAAGPDSACRTVMDDVFVRSVVLREGGRTVCLVSVDVLGLERKDIEDLRAAITAEAGIGPEDIVCHSTHTHESPSARSSASVLLAPHGLAFHSEGFYTMLLAGAGRAARQALDSLRPATARWGQAPVEDIASNRRCGVVRDDNPKIPWIRSSRARPEHRALPVGDIDPLVRALVFCADDGRPFGVMFNYACHVTVAGGDEAPYITADFPGEAIRRLEAEDGLEAIHFTGAAGDINPGKFTGSGNSIEERAADVRNLGGRYAEAIRAAVRAAEPLGGDGLAWRTMPIFLPLHRDFPTTLDLAADISTAVAACKAAGNDARARSQALDRLQRPALRSAASRQAVGRQLATEIAALRIGDGGAVFLPGECFLEIDRLIRRRAGIPRYMTVAYGDLSMGYICSRQAYQEGGYESSVAFLQPEATDLLVEQAADLFHSLKV